MLETLCMLAFFSSEPVVIEAMVYDGTNGAALRSWSNGKVVESPVLEPTAINPSGCYVQVFTLEGTMIGIVGDSIIKGIKGEFHPCNPDIFAATYEPVEDTEEGDDA